MTGNEDFGLKWTNRYLEEKLEGRSEVSAERGPPPEAASYMDDLTDADFSYLHPNNRKKHLETAVYALVSALADDDGVAEWNLHGRAASAFRDDEHVVVVMRGLGEIIDVDLETAALLAFAYTLDPREVVTSES